MQSRQIVLDTETTGLNVKDGHRIIEIAAVELINRKITHKKFHTYIRTEKSIDPEAFAVHGISSEFLSDKPTFQEIVSEFLNFIQGAELFIHNAPFDLGFLNHELKLIKKKSITHYCTVSDTLQMARKKHPGQSNSLDALCKRYRIDHSSRQLHGALLDAHLLAQVYLAMTGGQISIFEESGQIELPKEINFHDSPSNSIMIHRQLKVFEANQTELEAHQKRLINIKQTTGRCLWLDNEVL